MKFEAGNKVKCIRDSVTPYLTLGKVYQLLPCSEWDRVRTIGDDGKSRMFFMDRWELVKDTPTIEDLITQGKTFLNKKCLGGETDRKFTPNQVVVVVDKDLARSYSMPVMDDFYKNGYSVGLRDTVNRITFPVLQTKLDEFIPIVIKLTDEYQATIHEDHVRVGCQCIPRSKIDELYNLIHGKD